MLSLSRINIRVLTGVLTGHCLLRYHLNKMGLEEITECRLCGEGRRLQSTYSATAQPLRTHALGTLGMDFSSRRHYKRRPPRTSSPSPGRRGCLRSSS
ncbi:unnamed protein product, partial [Nesidiocoris tenuis]